MLVCTVLLSMMLLSVQFCAGVKVLRDWGIVAVNGDSTVSEVFHEVVDKLSLPTASAFPNSMLIRL